MEEPAPFSDVDSGSWYAGYIAAAYRTGLLRGYEDHTFVPDGKITRQEAAVAIERLVSTRGHEPEERDFIFQDDSQIEEWAKSSVYALYSKGIITGRTASVFAPAETLTRAESAVLLYRAASWLGQ